jgi:hypothetical protein
VRHAEPDRSANRYRGAAIARWFGTSPFGPLFFADDGRAWPIGEEAAAKWKAEANGQLSEFLADVPFHQTIGFVFEAFVFLLALWLGRLLA